MKYRLIASALLVALLGAVVYVMEGGSSNAAPAQATPQGSPDDKALNALKIPN